MCGPTKRRFLGLGAACLLVLGLCSGAQAADVPESRMLVPVGHTIGIKLFARGVVVSRLPEGETPAKVCGLRTGDVIEACGGETVTSTEQFQSLLQKNGENGTELAVRRQNRNLCLPVAPKQNGQGAYCIGAWVRDSMAGIGTMTYYDPKSGEFGALGHGITDVDTALLMPFSNGSILPASVKAVKRGAPGEAGELRGDFDLTGNLGPLQANTDRGIFGKLTESLSGPAVPVGRAKPGPATLRANVTGDAVETYDVEILRVTPGAANGRDLLLAVTDQDLLDRTGGIVQGMSGSPILQDGKLVGAVTHVLLNDATKGYGILMETMLEAAE